MQKLFAFLCKVRSGDLCGSGPLLGCCINVGRVVSDEFRVLLERIKTWYCDVGLVFSKRDVGKLFARVVQASVNHSVEE